MELVEVAGHDLAHRADRIGELLLPGVHDEVAPRSGRGQQEQLVDESLADRQEGLLGDVVEQAPQLARQLSAQARATAGSVARSARRASTRSATTSELVTAWMLIGAGPPMTRARPATSPLRA